MNDKRILKFKAKMQKKTESPFQRAETKWVFYGIGNKPRLAKDWFFVVEDLQFTGHTDDKGNDIYDGDFVRFTEGHSLVEWNGDICQFQFSNGLPLNDGETYGVKKLVVGNRIDDPHLYQGHREDSKIILTLND